MAVLHLVGNWKVTGPVAPALELAAALARGGEEVRVAVGAPPEPHLDLAGEYARCLGLRPAAGLRLPKHFSARALREDARALLGSARAGWLQALHVHGTNEHLVAALVRRRTGLPVVRSLYGGTLARLRRRDRWLLRWATDGVVAAGREEAAWVARQRPDLVPTRLLRHPGGVDLHRFDPERRSAPVQGVFRLGVVARVQPHRRFDLILEALAQLKDLDPPVRLCVVGRGTRYEEVLVQPAVRLGLRDQLELPGYLEGEAYVEALTRFSAAVYLVPGTDGTGRAVRELMALGIPVIASRRGLLPELLGGEEAAGLLLPEETAPALAAAVRRLHRDPALRARLGRAARERARRLFDYAALAAKVARLYRALGVDRPRRAD